MERLLAGGWHVLELHEGAVPQAERRTRWLLRRRGLHLATFARQLAVLCGSGVPLVQSLNVLIEQTAEGRGRKILSGILELVKGGSSLNEAMAQQEGVFPEVMLSMVRVGELSGRLDDVLARLAQLFEREDELKAQVRAALAYPLLVLVLGLASAGALVAFVIPRLSAMFETLDQRLPLPTRILCGISSAVGAYWWALAAGIAALVFGIRAAGRRPGFRLWWDRLKMRVPLAGTLIRQAAVARFARALGTLAQADVPIVEALNVAQAAAGNAAVAAVIRQMAGQVQEGDSLAALMRSAEIFPPLAVQMAAVGEETGHLDQMLAHVADAYDREVSASTKLMTSLLAPVLILAVAAIVAFLVVSLVLPIFRLSAGIH
jgi:type II secretory pathway component PulF